VTYKNVVFAALFQTNHNILTAIITAFLQKKKARTQLIKYFRIIKFTYKCNEKKIIIVC